MAVQAPSKEATLNLTHASTSNKPYSPTIIKTTLLAMSTTMPIPIMSKHCPQITSTKISLLLAATLVAVVMPHKLKASVLVRSFVPTGWD